MSKPKKLDLTLDELKQIAIELNENTIANRDRSKEDKIPTDKYIRQFGILRKDFSETIKGTCISYNRSTFLYDIDAEIENSNTAKAVENTDVNAKRDNKVTPVATPSNTNSNTNGNTSSNTTSNTKVTHSNTIGNTDVIKILKEELPEIFEMIEMYKNGEMKEEVLKNKKDMNIDKNKLSGEVITRSVKSYKNVLDEFSQFCKKKKETQKDLLSMALLEFMEKYK